MKNLLRLLLCILPAGFVAAQRIEIYPDNVRGLEKTLTLTGTPGKSTATVGVILVNRTRQTVRVYARPHVDQDALFCIDKAGVTSVDFSLEIRPGGSETLYVFGFLDPGQPRICDGYLALAITALQPDGNKGATRTSKLPVTLNFKGNASTAVAQSPGNRVATHPPAGQPANGKRTAPEAVPAGKPDRYDVVSYQGQPMRWHLRQLPLKIYSDHGRTGDTAARYAQVVRRVVDIWNGVGRESKLKVDFFQIVDKPGQADIRLDWTGRRLLEGAQGTAYPSDGMVGMLPLNRFYSTGRAGETLLQELGHMLGLGHSEVGEDIMFHRARNYCPDLAHLGVTTRDRQMLVWLYSQQQYVAFR